LGGRHGHERMPLRIHWVPGLARAPRPAHRVLDDAAVPGPVETLAVDAHRGGDDHASHRPVDELLEQCGGAAIVDRDVPLDRVHALADADLGGEVYDRAHTVQGSYQSGCV